MCVWLHTRQDSSKVLLVAHPGSSGRSALHLFDVALLPGAPGTDGAAVTVTESGVRRSSVSSFDSHMSTSVDSGHEGGAGGGGTSAGDEAGRSSDGDRAARRGSGGNRKSGTATLAALREAGDLAPGHPCYVGSLRCVRRRAIAA